MSLYKCIFKNMVGLLNRYNESLNDINYEYQIQNYLPQKLFEFKKGACLHKLVWNIDRKAWIDDTENGDSYIYLDLKYYLNPFGGVMMLQSNSSYPEVMKYQTASYRRLNLDLICFPKMNYQKLIYMNINKMVQN